MGRAATGSRDWVSRIILMFESFLANRSASQNGIVKERTSESECRQPDSTEIPSSPVARKDVSLSSDDEIIATVLRHNTHL